MQRLSCFASQLSCRYNCSLGGERVSSKTAFQEETNIPGYPRCVVDCTLQGLKMLGISDFVDIYDLSSYSIVDASEEQQQEW
jgi:hypothetical protein